MKIRLLFLFGALALGNSHAIAEQATATVAQDKLESVSAELHKHTAVLASDAFGGRAPATEGEALTTAYLVEQFKALGLAPGNGDSYLQRVPSYRTHYRRRYHPHHEG